MTLDRPQPRKRRQVRIEVSRLQMLIDGDIKIEDLDDDEIFRMQLKDKNGHFKGRPPAYIPTELARAWVNEQKRRVQTQFNEMLPEAMKAHMEMLKSRHLAPGDAARLAAIKEAYDRTLGKVGSETHITVDKGPSFDEVAQAIVVELNEVKDDDY